MTTFSRNVIKILQQVPFGKVTTYGAVSQLAGSSAGARQVVRILHSSSNKYNLPWHRVVNRLGQIPERSSMSHLEQKRRLQDEGVEVSETGLVNLDRFLWSPEGISLD